MRHLFLTINHSSADAVASDGSHQTKRPEVVYFLFLKLTFHQVISTIYVSISEFAIQISFVCNYLNSVSTLFLHNTMLSPILFILLLKKS